MRKADLRARLLALGTVLLADGARAQEGAVRFPAVPPAQNWVVHAEAIYTADGDDAALRKGGIVRIQNGKIAALSPVAGPGEGGAYALEAAAVTPGLIDLSARLTKGFASTEQSREVTPELGVWDALDLHDPGWTALARTGVTTALACPPDWNVIGGLGVALKTAGEPSLDARVLQRGAVLRGAMGSQPSARNRSFGIPSDFYARRPTTRMAVEWEHRKAFYAAAAAKRDPARAFPGSVELQRVLAGELPFMVQAWTTQDIRTAVFLAEELQRELGGKLRLLVDAAAEAWREPQLLTRSKCAVVLPPHRPQGRTTENAFFALSCAAELARAGIPFALSAHGSTQIGSTLDCQAGWAMRGGLGFDLALQSVTIQPARLIGVAGRVGSLEVGKDADLVLWNGTPFEPTSRVIGVIVEGRLILDPRAP
jgi:imidazolonepropionase-like amidohydrolase